MLGQRFDPSEPTEVLIPALNEEEGVGATISELAASLHARRIIVIDGHSTDRTVEVAKDRGAEIVFQDGKGKGDAIAKAVRHLGADAKYVAITDGDYTYPAEYLPEMIQILEVYPWVGMVCGNRFCYKPKKSTFKRGFRFGNKLLAFVHNFLNGVDMQDPLTGMRVVRAGILRDWIIKSKGFDIEVELNNQVIKQGFELCEVPISYRERVGEKKLRMKHGVSILKRILSETL